MIRYDLNDLNPATRVEIIQQVRERGIPSAYESGVLSVDEKFEAIVDYAVDKAERRGLEEARAQQQHRLMAHGSAPMRCEACGATPAAQLFLRKQVGMVIAMKTESFGGVLCLACGQELRKKLQRDNAVKGWTGVYSAAMNPVVIATNERNFNAFKTEIKGWSEAT